VTGTGKAAETRGDDTPRAEQDAAPETPTVKPTPREAAESAFEILLEKKGRDVLLLDIGGCSDLADYMLIATAGSSRQVAALASEVDRRLRARGLRRLNLSGLELGVWAVLDFGDLFVHVMQERERRYYDLEALWADGVVVRKEAVGTGPAAAADDDEDADE
jgi:ribosome-associated protein